jgi:X-X-X-Leu-X-X-Gly heptad repeat protein
MSQTAIEPQVTKPLTDRNMGIGASTLYLFFAPPPPVGAGRGGLGGPLSKEESPTHSPLFTSLFHGGGRVTHLSSEARRRAVSQRLSAILLSSSGDLPPAYRPSPEILPLLITNCSLLIDFGQARPCGKTDQLYDKTDQLYDKTDQLYDKTDQLYDKTDQLCGKTDQLCGKTDQLYGKTDQFYDKTDQFYDKTDQFYDKTDQFYDITDGGQNRRNRRETASTRAETGRGRAFQRHRYRGFKPSAFGGCTKYHFFWRNDNVQFFNRNR